MVARKVLSWSFRLFASPEYLREAGAPIKLADLAGHRFVLLEAHTRPRPEIDLINGKKIECIALPGPIISNSLGNVRAMTLAGGGIGLLPQRMAQEYLNKRQLVPVLPAWQSKPLEFHYIVSARRLLPAKTRLFVEELVEYFRTEERAGNLRDHDDNLSSRRPRR